MVPSVSSPVIECLETVKIIGIQDNRDTGLVRIGGDTDMADESRDLEG